MRTEFIPPSVARAAFRLPTLSRLPPLTALRAFVVAARHASFSRAAEELHVSTAAIGQQVRILETHLGQTLFSRQRGGPRSGRRASKGSNSHPPAARTLRWRRGSVALR